MQSALNRDLNRVYPLPQSSSSSMPTSKATSRRPPRSAAATSAETTVDLVLSDNDDSALGNSESLMQQVFRDCVTSSNQTLTEYYFQDSVRRNVIIEGAKELLKPKEKESTASGPIDNSVGGAGNRPDQMGSVLRHNESIQPRPNESASPLRIGTTTLLSQGQLNESEFRCDSAAGYPIKL